MAEATQSTPQTMSQAPVDYSVGRNRAQLREALKAANVVIFVRPGGPFSEVLHLSSMHNSGTRRIHLIVS